MFRACPVLHERGVEVIKHFLLIIICVHCHDKVALIRSLSRIKRFHPANANANANASTFSTIIHTKWCEPRWTARGNVIGRRLIPSKEVLDTPVGKIVIGTIVEAAKCVVVVTQMASDEHAM